MREGGRGPGGVSDGDGERGCAETRRDEGGRTEVPADGDDVAGALDVVDDVVGRVPARAEEDGRSLGRRDREDERLAVAD